MYTISLRKSPPPITRYLIDSGTRDIYYDSSKAEQEFGWDVNKAIEPIDLKN